jgi:predicted ribosome quality control (RQC) complex YloA/Tae2 family protein
MKCIVDLRKSVNENASIYFEKAKKLKKKIEGIETTIDTYRKKEIHEIALKEKEEERKRKHEWFEKFRWFFTSAGNLCIGGKDATTNELIIKKHVDVEDKVFHTEAPGSPFFVLKSKNPSKEELEEAGIATGCYSKAWQRGISGTDVFYVLPEQVSKEAQSGEYISKGSFMIRGKKNFLKVSLQLGIGIDANKRVMAGPVSAIITHCTKTITLVQGDTKTSDVAKKLEKRLGGTIDEFVRVIPAGGAKIK